MGKTGCNVVQKGGEADYPQTLCRTSQQKADSLGGVVSCGGFHCYGHSSLLTQSSYQQHYIPGLIPSPFLHTFTSTASVSLAIAEEAWDVGEV
jgi:hypothetical protein